MLQTLHKRTYLLGDRIMRKEGVTKHLKTYKYRVQNYFEPRGPNHYPGSLSEWGDRWNMWNDGESPILIYLLIWE